MAGRPRWRDHSRCALVRGVHLVVVAEMAKNVPLAFLKPERPAEGAAQRPRHEAPLRPGLAFNRNRSHPRKSICGARRCSSRSVRKRREPAGRAVNARVVVLDHGVRISTLSCLRRRRASPTSQSSQFLWKILALSLGVVQVRTRLAESSRTIFGGAVRAVHAALYKRQRTGKKGQRNDATMRLTQPPRLWRWSARASPTNAR